MKKVKNFSKPASFFLVSALAGSMTLISACATGQSSNGQDLARTGPTVLDARTNPGTIALNQALQPVSSAQVLADVKDFTGKVQNVRLRFTHIPIEVPMTQATPSTWVANLTQKELRMLAVNGHTMKYQANVIARDNQGHTGVSQKPVEIAVKAPDITSTG